MTDKKELSELEKLRVLIPHWVEHSHSHQHEFKKWVDLTRHNGHENAAQEIEKALQKLTEADAALRKALENLGGAVEGHHHHH